MGSFTSEQRKARGNGINAYRMDPATGAWTHIQQVGDLVNPSFLVLSKDQRALYSVHGDENHATAFAVDPESGKLKLLGRADTGGKNGVRQALDPSGKFLIVANYASGTVAVLPVAEDGALRDKSQLVELKGTPGPHRVRQTSSHPHDIVFDPSGRFVVVPDLGLDRTFVFRFDPAGGQLTEASFVDGRPTSGPRHVAFHPTRPIMWILNELDSTMTTCQWDGERGALRPVQVITTLATGYTGNSTAAELAVSPSGGLRLCVEPRRRRYLRLCGGPGHGRAERGGMGAEPGQRPALHRAHALGAASSTPPTRWATPSSPIASIPPAAASPRPGRWCRARRRSPSHSPEADRFTRHKTRSVPLPLGGGVRGGVPSICWVATRACNCTTPSPSPAGCGLARFRRA